MRAKRLVLLSSRSLFAAGVQRLLEDSDGIELSTVAADEAGWVTKVKHLAPKVIVMDSSDCSLDQGVIARLLEEHPRARGIALSLNHAGMDVYWMKRVPQTNVDGLLGAIQGKGASTKGTRKQRSTSTKVVGNGGEKKDS